MDASVSQKSCCLIVISFLFFRDKEVFVDLWREKVKIIGIDDFGFLKVKKSSNGDIVTLQADAHSFDVLQGIIREKAI